MKRVASKYGTSTYRVSDKPRLSICLALTSDLASKAEDLFEYLLLSGITDVEVVAGFGLWGGLSEGRQKNVATQSSTAPYVAFTNAGVYPPHRLVRQTIAELERDENAFVQALRNDGTKDYHVVPNPYALGDWQALSKSKYWELGGYNLKLIAGAGLDSALAGVAIEQGMHFIMMEDRVYHAWHPDRFDTGSYAMRSQWNQLLMQAMKIPEYRLRFPEVSELVLQNSEPKVVEPNLEAGSGLERIPYKPSVKEYWTLVNSAKLRRCRPLSAYEIRVLTHNPVALESVDHTHPDACVKDISHNPAFLTEISGKVGRSPMWLLDLGCASGAMVLGANDDGHLAVGLEGSDEPAKQGHGGWPTLHNKRLFTCDITKPFWVLADNEPAQFDVVTAWDVMEHIAKADLESCLTNIDNHLKPGGLFVATISSEDSPDPRDEANHHQTVEPQQWWKDKLSERWEYIPLVMRQMIRWPYPAMIFKKHEDMPIVPYEEVPDED